MRSSFIEGHTSELSFSTHQTQLENPNKRHTLTLQMSVIIASPYNLPSKTPSFSLPYIHLFLSYMCKALQLSITHEYLKISLFPTFMRVFRNSSKSAATQSSSSSLWPAAQHLHLLLLEHDQKFSRSQKTSLPAAGKYDLGRRFDVSLYTAHLVGKKRKKEKELHKRWPYKQIVKLKLISSESNLFVYWKLNEVTV